MLTILKLKVLQQRKEQIENGNSKPVINLIINAHGLNGLVRLGKMVSPPYLITDIVGNNKDLEQTEFRVEVSACHIGTGIAKTQKPKPGGDGFEGKPKSRYEKDVAYSYRQAPSNTNFILGGGKKQVPAFLADATCDSLISSDASSDFELTIERMLHPHTFKKVSRDNSFAAQVGQLLLGFDSAFFVDNKTLQVLHNRLLEQSTQQLTLHDIELILNFIRVKIEEINPNAFQNIVGNIGNVEYQKQLLARIEQELVRSSGNQLNFKKSPLKFILEFKYNAPKLSYKLKTAEEYKKYITDQMQKYKSFCKDHGLELGLLEKSMQEAIDTYTLKIDNNLIKQYYFEDLFESCLHDRLDYLEYYLDLTSDIKPDINNNLSGTTLLHIASSNNDATLALLKKGANPNIVDGEGRTALFFACFKGNGEVVKTLLEEGADPNITKYAFKRYAFITPLDIACSESRHDVAALFLKHFIKSKNDYDLDKSIKTLNGYPLLFVEKVLGNLSPEEKDKVSSKLPTPSTAKPDIKENSSTTSLHDACKKGDNETVKTLLAAKTDPNTKDADDFTPLYIACQRGDDKIVEALLGAGAKLETECGGNTPLHISCLSGYNKIVKALLKAGANPNAEDEDGLTPLKLACQPGHHETAALFLKHFIEKRNDGELDNSIKTLNDYPSLFVEKVLVNLSPEEKAQVSSKLPTTHPVNNRSRVNEGEPEAARRKNRAGTLKNKDCGPCSLI